MFDLERAWNCNMRLKFAVKRAAMCNIPKQVVVNFWRESARKLGYSGSYPKPLLKQNCSLSRDEIIAKYSVHTGMFGNYAQWHGLSINHFLRKAGYDPLPDAKKK